jgi:hypothetical protein
MAVALKVLLVLGCNKAIWKKEAHLPFPPFPGLGIRIDVYDMLNVESVVTGDPGFDATCICTVENGIEYDPDRLRTFGFERGSYP